MAGKIKKEANLMLFENISLSLLKSFFAAASERKG